MAYEESIKRLEASIEQLMERIAEKHAHNSELDAVKAENYASIKMYADLVADYRNSSKKLKEIS